MAVFAHLGRPTHFFKKTSDLAWSFFMKVRVRSRVRKAQESFGTTKWWYSHRREAAGSRVPTSRETTHSPAWWSAARSWFLALRASACTVVSCDRRSALRCCFLWKKVQDKGLGAPCREKPLEKSGLEPAAPNCLADRKHCALSTHPIPIYKLFSFSSGCLLFCSLCGAAVCHTLLVTHSPGGSLPFWFLRPYPCHFKTCFFRVSVQTVPLFRPQRVCFAGGGCPQSKSSSIRKANDRVREPGRKGRLKDLFEFEELQRASSSYWQLVRVPWDTIDHALFDFELFLPTRRQILEILTDRVKGHVHGQCFVQTTYDQWAIFTKRGSGGIMADVCLFLARPYVFCVLFLYSRSVKEARLRFSNTALPK